MCLGVLVCWAVAHVCQLVLWVLWIVRCWVLSDIETPLRGGLWGRRRGEGVSLLRKITITVDDVTLNCLRAMRELNGIPYSAAVRRAVWSYYQDKCFIMPDSSPAPGAGAVAPDSRKDAPALEG